MNETMGFGAHPALTDDQTGLPNRLHFETVFRVLFATGSRGVPLSVVLLEIDGFTPWSGSSDGAEVNRVFRAIGNTLRPVVRSSDLVARTDETRFTICLLDCNVAGAVLVADRIDGLLDGIREATGLRFSMGGAAFDPDMKNPQDLVGAAEASLRSAQAKGGDTMEFDR